MAGKTLLQKMLDRGAMMVFGDVVRDALKSETVKAVKAKVREVLGETGNKAGKRKSDEEDL